MRNVDGVQVLTGKTSATSVETLREAGDHLRDKLGSGVVVLGTVLEGEPKLVAMVTQDVIAKGIRAGDIIAGISPMVGGKGGRQAQHGPGGRKRCLRAG